MKRYFVVYKPYNMISQFVSPYDQILLGDLNYAFPPGTNAVGRLDEDSEGLLILTTDKTLSKRLLHPDKRHVRGYVVQVDKKIEDPSLERMRNGLEIQVKRKGTYKTQPCSVKRIDKPIGLPPRENSFNERLPHSWLEVVLMEGKNRQIRKMCSAVRHKCRRLIRTRIENLELGNLQPGEVKEMGQKELFELLLLDNDPVIAEAGTP